jgi:hypothetical protein
MVATTGSVPDVEDVIVRRGTHTNFVSCSNLSSEVTDMNQRFPSNQNQLSYVDDSVYDLDEEKSDPRHYECLQRCGRRFDTNTKIV